MLTSKEKIYLELETAKKLQILKMTSTKMKRQNAEWEKNIYKLGIFNKG